MVNVFHKNVPKDLECLEHLQNLVKFPFFMTCFYLILNRIYKNHYFKISLDQVLNNSIPGIMICNMSLYYQRHENNDGLKAEVKFFNFGIFAGLPHSFY